MSIPVNFCIFLCRAFPCVNHLCNFCALSAMDRGHALVLVINDNVETIT